MEIKLSFAGDLMCKLPQLKASWIDGKYNFNPVFDKISCAFHDSNYVVGNMETPLAGPDLGFTKTATNFNAPIEFAKAAQKAGFDFFAIANNHCLDRGVKGLFNTIDNLKSINADYSGAYKTREESLVPFVKTINELRIAILSYTYGTNSEWLGNELDEAHKDCVDLFRKQDAFITPEANPFSSLINPIKNLAKKYLPQSIRERIKPIVIEDCVKNPDLLPCDEYFDNKLKEKIRIAKDSADIVIMYMHSGGQFNSKVGDYTKNLAHRLVDYGCDIVIGSHPHCVLNYETYKGKFIAYSLGNFCYTPHYGYHYDGVFSDYSVIVNLYLDSNEKKLTRKTIVVTKTVLESDGNSVVYPVSSLVKQIPEKEKQQLEKDVRSVLRRFFGGDIECDIWQEEIDVVS